MISFGMGEDKDVDSAVALLSTAFPDDNDLFFYAREDKFYIAKDGAGVVGVAYPYFNYLHDKYLKVFIAVLPSYRRQGVGKRLHELLLKEYSRGGVFLGFEGFCKDQQEESKKFLNSISYKWLLDTYVVTLLFDQKRKFKYYKEPIPISGLIENDERSKSIRDFLRARYIEFHSWSPVAELDSAVWSEIVFDDVSPEFSVALLDGDEVLGVSTASVSQGGLEIVWCYARHSALLKQAETLKALLGKQFELAVSAGLAVGNMEIDSNYVELVGLLDWLPIRNVVTYSRYRLDIL